jgi:hypothetical protein
MKIDEALKAAGDREGLIARNPRVDVALLERARLLTAGRPGRAVAQYDLSRPFADETRAPRPGILGATTQPRR